MGPKVRMKLHLNFYALRFLRNIFDWIYHINDENVKKKSIVKSKKSKYLNYFVVESKLISMNYKG